MNITIEDALLEDIIQSEAKLEIQFLTQELLATPKVRAELWGWLRSRFINQMKEVDIVFSKELTADTITDDTEFPPPSSRRSGTGGGGDVTGGDGGGPGGQGGNKKAAQ